jgi:Uma2 family endonuclease
MSARIEPLMTVDDLEAMPEDGNRYEVIEGELFVSCAPGLTHQIVTSNIIRLIGRYLDDHPIGSIIPTPGLILDLYTGVVPDVVFFTHQRGAEIIAKERLNATPELVIEILSPGKPNIERDRVAKFQLYGKFGVEEYWIIDMDKQAVEIYANAGQSLTLNKILSGDETVTSPLLPEFSCAASRFFQK